MINSKSHTALTILIDGKKVAEDAYTVSSFSRSFGGGRTDQATIVVEPGTRTKQKHLQDFNLRPSETEKSLQIMRAGTCVFWGWVDDASYSIGSTEEKTLVASIQPYRFGDPLTAVQYLDVRPRSSRGSSGQATEVVVLATENVVFNGFVDDSMMSEKTTGKFVGNKAGQQNKKYRVKDRNGKNSEGTAHLPIPLESVQTQSGRDRYRLAWVPGTATNRWDLRDAIEYICLLCNPNETFIANPINADLEGISDFVLPRTELQLGRYLPDYLDQLLEPYGHFWYVDVTGDKPRIAFAKWGIGEEVEANYAAVGEPADFDTTNIIHADASYSISQTTNEIHVIGAPIEFEGTFELRRVGYDKFAFNEAGDYKTSTFTQARSGDDATFFQGREVAFPNLSQVFPSSALGDFGDSQFVQRIYRRRRFLPTLTQMGPPSTGGDAAATELRPIGPNNGYDIEVLDLRQDDAAEADKKWVNIDELDDPMWRNVRVLSDECAIVFDRGRDQGRGTADEENSVHEAENSFLVALDDKVRVRITATIVADFAVQVRVTRPRSRSTEAYTPGGIAPAQPSTGGASVAAKKHTFVWQNPNRWPCRHVIHAGRYRSKYRDETYSMKTQTADDIVADMTKEARKILDRTDCAPVSGALTFFGLHNEVPLGGVVRKIAGRELDFGMRPRGDTQVHPQVVAVHWNAQDATIVAQLSMQMGGFGGFE